MKNAETAVLGVVESLGDNCELGFYLRSKEQDTSSLLQWAVCPVDKLINHIEHIESIISFDFDKLQPYSEGMIKDASTGYSFHTAMRSEPTAAGLTFESSLDTRREIYIKEKSKYDHQLSKFKTSLLGSEKKVFVIKANKAISSENITKLHSAISERKETSNFVLLVVFADKNHAQKQPIHWINESLCHGYIEKFAPYSKAFDVDIDGWDKMFNEVAESEKIKSWFERNQKEESNPLARDLENWDVNAPNGVKMELLYGIKKDSSQINCFQKTLTFLHATDPKFAKSIGADIFNCVKKQMSDVSIERMDARYLNLIQIYANYDIDAAIDFHQKAEILYKSNSNSHIRYARLSNSLEKTNAILSCFSRDDIITKPIRPKYDESFDSINTSLESFLNHPNNTETNRASLINLQLPRKRKRMFSRYSCEDDTDLADNKWISGVCSDDIQNILFYTLPKAHICHEPTGVGFEEDGKIYYVQAMSDMYHYHRVAGITALSKQKRKVPNAYILPRYGINNYYHSLVDRLPGLSGYKPLKLSCPIFTTYALSETEKHFSRLIGVDPEAIIFDSKGENRIDMAYLPNIGGLRALFFDFVRTMPIESSPVGEKIYISRKNTSNRVLLNEKEIESTVQSMGFDIVEMENYSLEEQIKIASGAHTIVAPHGAGLANMLFAPPESNVIELIPDRYMTPLFKQLAIDCNHRYSVLVGQVDTRAETDQNNMNWQVDKNRLVNVLQSAL